MFTLNEITRITRGCLKQGNGLRKIKRLVIDSRRVKKGDLFIAVKGERFNGHDFIRQAAQKGALAVLGAYSPKRLSKDLGIIQVADTVSALGYLARAHRQRFSLRVVAVTGSAGKTTTKELIAAIIRDRYKVLKNLGTENNHIGVPLTLLKLRPGHQTLVLEMGTNRPGDIPWLASLIQPTVAVLTNIGSAHLEQLKTPSGVFREKAAVLKDLGPSGTVIFNKDDPYLRKLSRGSLGCSQKTFAIDQAADYRATDIKFDSHHVYFTINGQTPVKLSGPVRHNVYNALAAFACGRLFGIDPATLADRLGRYRSLRGRLRFHVLGGRTVIDDTYNANPLSFAGALTALGQAACSGRRVLVCADMLELGTQSDRLHADCGRLAGRARLDLIVAYGPKARQIVSGAQRMNARISAYHFKDLDKLNNFLKHTIREGDALLIKGSRAMHMERTLDFLNAVWGHNNKGS